MKLNSSEEGAFLFCLFLVDSVFFENSFDTLTDRFLLRKRDQSSARNRLWEAAEKDADLKDYQNKYIAVIRSAFEIDRKSTRLNSSH